MGGPVVQWDEVPSRLVREGQLDARFTNLGVAAGTVQVGLRREQITAGKRGLPPHVHTAEEELFFILAGWGWSWQDGQACEIRAGDCLCHRSGRGAHALLAGPGGLDALAFGERVPTEMTLLPRGKVAWIGPSWVAAGEGEHPWARDAAAGDLEPPVEAAGRPSHVVNLSEVEPRQLRRGDVDVALRDVGRAAGSVRVGLQHGEIPPGGNGLVPHCHSEEEELFVVLDGEGWVLLQAAGKIGWAPDEHPVRRGSVVALPAGTGVTHSFRAGPEGLSYLAFGQRRPGDLRWYPRSQKVRFPGLGIIGRFELTHYWDGEE